MTKDVKVSADHGTVENNYHNFFVSNNATITSEEMIMKSKNFYLKDRNILHTKEKTNYQIKTIEGVAKDGIKYNIKLNILSFFNSKGTYERNEKKYHFRAKLIRLFKDQQLLRFN